jgi:histidinol-phosphatase (PHP family)
MLADLHVHTRFSCDSKATMAEYCEQAATHGINCICFTEHVDYNKNDCGYGFYKPDEFFDEFKRIQEMYADKLMLLCGIEFSEPHIYKKELETLSKLPYDFILGSVHYWIDDLFPSQMVAQGIPVDKAYERYWQEIYKAVESGGFDSLAHIDFPKRYYKKLNYDKAQMIDIFKCMIKNNISLEINTSSLRKGLTETLPGKALLEIYDNAGGQNVTFGSDSHNAYELGSGYNEAKALITGNLVNCIYQNRKLIRIPQIEIRTIPYGTDEYKKELTLRDEFLRKPLSMSIYDDDIDAEKNDLHIGAYFNGNLVGTLLLIRIDEEQMKMRQVVVAQALCGQGIGGQMVRFAQDVAVKAGFRKIVLNARKTAVSFYEKMGYQVTGEEFLEVSIPHMHMFINL